MIFLLLHVVCMSCLVKTGGEGQDQPLDGGGPDQPWGGSRPTPGGRSTPTPRERLKSKGIVVHVLHVLHVVHVDSPISEGQFIKKYL